MVDIPFHLIQVNETREGREIIFPYGTDWYRCPWEKVPSRFKRLYVVKLKLMGYKIPDYLKDYETETITVSNVNVSIDLDNCKIIPSEYPVR